MFFALSTTVLHQVCHAHAYLVDHKHYLLSNMISIFAQHFIDCEFTVVKDIFVKV